MKFNFNKIFFSICWICLFCVVGCIHNDLPYPRLVQTITSIAVRGESRAALIDSTNLKATLYLEETTDIQNVKFTEFSVSPGASSDVNLLDGTYNLETPLEISITLYQTYDWEISAVQNIIRYFTIEGQVGESEIDVVAKRVIVYLPEGSDLENLKITSMKLGPEKITTYTPNLIGGIINLSQPFTLGVTYHDRTEYWTIYGDVVEQTVWTDKVEAWSEVIWAYGSCEAEKKGAFQYKPANSDTWIDVDNSYITQTGGSFHCYIPHLQPLTSYDVRALVEDEYATSVTVTTQATMDLPDASFDQWWKNGNVWNPWNEGGTPYWDTSNKGAATLGQSNVLPTEHSVIPGLQAAELNTRFIGIGILGKLGAGSIYTGSFKRTEGTNGVLDFGRPFNLRPTKLRGYYQYKTAPISSVSRSNPDLQYMLNQPDTCHIYIALTNWSEPYEIRTNPNNRQLFNKDADYVIAYGELLWSGTMDDYEEFEIELEYRDYFTIPSYIQITCAASKYGDFFTGGNGAVLYVDEFSLSYDY